jgi:hypothetical protein
MGIGASRPQRPDTPVSWLARVGLVLLLAALVGLAWLFVWPPQGRALPEGPVVVLGGGAGDRLALGLDIVEEAGGDRELVLSDTAADRWERAGGDCARPRVHCLRPDPQNTFGEARATSLLVDERGWTEVTVVTSEFHVTRSRLYFHRCLDAVVAVVASDSGRSVLARVGEIPRELLGVIAALGNVRYC